MSAKRSLHHMPRPVQHGVGRLLVTLHKDLALQRKGSLGDMQKRPLDNQPRSQDRGENWLLKFL